MHDKGWKSAKAVLREAYVNNALKERSTISPTSVQEMLKRMIAGARLGSGPRGNCPRAKTAQPANHRDDDRDPQPPSTDVRAHLKRARSPTAVTRDDTARS